MFDFQVGRRREDVASDILEMTRRDSEDEVKLETDGETFTFRKEARAEVAS